MPGASSPDITALYCEAIYESEIVPALDAYQRILETF